MITKKKTGTRRKFKRSAQSDRYRCKAEKTRGGRCKNGKVEGSEFCVQLRTVDMGVMSDTCTRNVRLLYSDEPISLVLTNSAYFVYYVIRECGNQTHPRCRLLSCVY